MTIWMDPKCPTILLSFWSLQKDEHLSMPHPDEQGNLSLRAQAFYLPTNGQGSHITSKRWVGWRVRSYV